MRYVVSSLEQLNKVVNISKTVTHRNLLYGQGGRIQIYLGDGKPFLCKILAWADVHLFGELPGEVTGRKIAGLCKVLDRDRVFVVFVNRAFCLRSFLS